MTATMSTTPCFFNLQGTVSTFNNVVAHLPERVERGRYLFLLCMAGFLRGRLQAHAPEVLINGVATEYAQGLRIALLQGAGTDADAVAIYLANEHTALTEAQVERTALYVRAHRTSPPWVGVLTRWGPWPAEMLPVKIAGGEARVISRVARPDEIKALTARILGRRQQILAELVKAGADKPTLERTPNAVGTEVCEDIAHAVLRREFGMDGAAPRAHWRPAFREVMAAVPDAMRRFNRYVETGRESAFAPLPDVADDLTMGQLRTAMPFTAELAPFVPKS